ncbi:MAG: N-acyl-D-aspartate/D-glutamate deacylase [Chloroflexi bacterium AL-W]|nr:N-acyl-D-aspartate/D-glutamate deacylase [Chloroflexi bacterium AL-N1]NOK68216.1 N-acyl-D-aspartate/D-glutamate deacylase [Chloroflexi bacterium AL-N10]NOK73862.1 N-acyl-D-aspartate/D-glutamate deacylase [Chloroflexi bacterium AL-N5]NOK82830.1 N-acyl-D-aspartate/D-glutamate deacylase [Chloroflexi bacterium AL-W]NOK90352.1 N-acyl-D-aspartate/D-glutamate deacylase [Chloroflexi bacterium AL-N15]
MSNSLSNQQQSDPKGLTLIRGAQVVDGTGSPWFYSDVAIQGNHIAAITSSGHIPPEQASEIIDAAGMVVCPGFIDILSHSILPLMVDGRCLSKIMQGVTTEIMGESWTPAPFGGLISDPFGHSPYSHHIEEWQQRAQTWHRLRDWLDAMIEHGVTPNIGTFLGGGTLREYAKGLTMGKASPDERATMEHIAREAMEDGAFGVSYALIYPPDAYVETDELIAVCKVVAEYGGIYITHLRSEADRLVESVEEALQIGTQAHIPVEIYHLKAAGKRNWCKVPEVIKLIDKARAEGLDITADMYPYIAAGTGLTSVLPPWAEADGKLFSNLLDPQMRAKIRAEVLNPSDGWEPLADLCGIDGVMVIGMKQPENQAYVGKRLDQIAAVRGQEWVDTVFDLLLSERQRINTIYFAMQEDNLKLQLQQPWMKISTDAGGVDPDWAAALGPFHPRAYGTYPRVLGKYVREEQVIPLEDAIRKMSSAVANRLGLRNRGLLRPGYYADMVIFDPQTIGDRATFEEPHQLAVGVRDVWVNGVRALANGKHTGATPGMIVNGPGANYS